jgi:hypothetical protein
MSSSGSINLMPQPLFCKELSTDTHCMGCSLDLQELFVDGLVKMSCPCGELNPISFVVQIIP